MQDIPTSSSHKTQRCFSSAKQRKTEPDKGIINLNKNCFGLQSITFTDTGILTNRNPPNSLSTQTVSSRKKLKNAHYLGITKYLQNTSIHYCLWK